MIPFFRFSCVNKNGIHQKPISDIIMGNWQLEATKFGLYIFAPVIAFAYFHKY